jgi:predicted acylesterase/phospholipase RssA
MARAQQAAPATAPSTAPPAGDAPAEEQPSHPPGLLQHLEFCRTLDGASPLYRACLRDAATTLHNGIVALQQAQPAVAPPSCPDATSATALDWDEEQGCFLKEAALLVADLRQTPPPTPKKLGESIANLQARAARRQPGNYTLISQGGVSLGSWQAGYSFILSEVLKEQRAEQRKRSGTLPQTATGASAGAINALIAGLESCNEQPTRVTESLFFRLWVDTLGLFGPNDSGLFKDGGSGEDLALFSSGPIDRGIALASDYAQALPVIPGCSFRLGLVVTHLRPRPAPVQSDALGRPLATVNGLTERFTLEVTPRRGAPPRVVNLSPPVPAGAPERVTDQAYYAHLGAASEPTFDDLLSAVRASSAFPFAFRPVPLEYQIYDPRLGTYEPGATQIDPTSGRRVSAPEEFVDGGTLDNVPVRLAARMNTWSAPAQRNSWLGELLAPRETYLLIKPDVLGWRPHALSDAQAAAERKSSLIDTYLSFVGQLLITGFDAELASTAEELRFIREESSGFEAQRLLLTQRQMPIAGEQLLHFFAFFERDFRVYDFAVGMADAVQQLRDEPELAKYVPAVSRRASDESWQYRCVEAYYSLRQHLTEDLNAKAIDAPFRDVDLKGACTPPLYSSDRKKLAESDVHGSNLLALIAAFHNQRRWTQSDQYRPSLEFSHLFEELEAQDFKFTDVEQVGGLLYGSSRQFFRRLLGQMVVQIADKHDFLEASVVRIAGRAAADSLVQREFPRWSLSLGVVLNGLETGFQGLIYSRPDLWSLRLDTNLRLYRVGRQALRMDAMSTEQRVTATGELTLGLTSTLGNGLVDGELFIGGGLFSHFAPGADDWVIRRSAGGLAALRLVGLQHVYLGIEYQHAFWSRISKAYEGSLIERLWDADRFSGAVGWRWLY